MSNKKYRDLVKKLVDLPPNTATPEYFDKYIEDKYGKLSNVQILFGEDMQVHPLIYAVDQNRVGPTVIIVNNSSNPENVDLALVGKGVTFDTGGYNIKTRGMEEMKSDKAGACTVLATLDYILDNDIKINVIAVLPFVENKITPTSTLPGSVITSKSGIKVEIVDTDAEGRLILADSITTALMYEPEHLITIATLTGACAFALGDEHIGRFIKEDTGVEDLSDIYTEYGKDKVINLSTAPGKAIIDKAYKKGKTLKNYAAKELAGSYAAEFLFKFSGGVYQHHVHLDIAGPAFVSGKATGAGIDTLIDYVEKYQND